MSTAIKLIALDLDGTLLMPDKSLSEGNKRALKRAVEEEGAAVTLATGRAYGLVKPILDEAPFIRYAVLSNGAVAADAEGNVLFRKVLTGEQALEIFDYIFKIFPDIDKEVDFFENGVRIVGAGWAEYIKRMNIDEGTRKLLEKSHLVEDQRAYLKKSEGVEKISARFLSADDKNRVFKVLEERFTDFQICSSLDCNIEITCRGITKSLGLQKLTEHLGIGMDEVIAFGDKGNDYEMIRDCGIGVAMGNAEPEVKLLADRITKSNVEDGVARMLEEVFEWQQVL